jgi:hypothetical protein
VCGVNIKDCNLCAWGGIQNTDEAFHERPPVTFEVGGVDLGVDGVDVRVVTWEGVILDETWFRFKDDAERGGAVGAESSKKFIGIIGTRITTGSNFFGNEGINEVCIIYSGGMILRRENGGDGGGDAETKTITET